MAKPRTGLWMAGAFLVSLAMAVMVLNMRGAGGDGTRTALRLTARWAYCFFWPAYAGGALRALFGPLFQPMCSRGRELGLAFAAAQLPHAALVAWLYYISPHPPLPMHSAVFFAIGLLLVYLLALLSIPRLFAALPRPLWRAIFRIGMEYIALAFLVDFFKNPFDHGLVNLVAYLPFLALAVLAPALRICAYARRVTEARRPYDPPGIAASRTPRS